MGKDLIVNQSPNGRKSGIQPGGGRRLEGSFRCSRDHNEMATVLGHKDLRHLPGPPVLLQKSSVFSLSLKWPHDLRSPHQSLDAQSLLLPHFCWPPGSAQVHSIGKRSCVAQKGKERPGRGPEGRGTLGVSPTASLPFLLVIWEPGFISFLLQLP
uniref:Uncharacterized protein n=1 Tax=Molossus molossus TaxID=27622 RepID=A0A7J8ER53_MOLMO|nr:hypothetical protein HJG59_008682 [Molossus molossus]